MEIRVVEGIDPFLFLKYFYPDLEFDPFLVATYLVILYLFYFLKYVFIELSCSIPRWENLPSGHQRYLLLGLNLGYMYWGQKHFSE